MSLKARFSLQCGFSLIEVMVAVVIIAIGLLGNAGMMALVQNNTAIARFRGLGAIEADSLASMMHANALYWQSPAVPSSGSGFSIAGTTISDATLNGQAIDCTTAPCTSVQMAGYDLKQWGLSLASLLPTGTGQVKCSIVAATPVSCVISISWNENNMMLNQSGTSVTQSYTLVVQP